MVSVNVVCLLVTEWAYLLHNHVGALSSRNLQAALGVRSRTQSPGQGSFYCVAKLWILFCSLCALSMCALTIGMTRSILFCISFMYLITDLKAERWASQTNVSLCPAVLLAVVQRITQMGWILLRLGKTLGRRIECRGGDPSHTLSPLPPS